MNISDKSLILFLGHSERSVRQSWRHQLDFRVGTLGSIFPMPRASVCYQLFQLVLEVARFFRSLHYLDKIRLDTKRLVDRLCIFYKGFHIFLLPLLSFQVFVKI